MGESTEFSDILWFPISRPFQEFLQEHKVHTVYLTSFYSSFSIETRFNQAIEVLSGYFCASLNILQFSNAIKPTIPTFPTRSIVPDSTHTALFSYFSYFVGTMIAGIIPQEPVCIENLQPWLDLLPCSNRAGLAQMIKPESIYQSDFHSIELEFFVNESMEIDLTLRMITVYDLNRWNANRNWSLTSLLGKSFVKSCPLSKNSPKVILRLPKSNQSEFISSLIHPKTEISALDDHLVIEYEGKDLLEEIGATEVPNQAEPIDKARPFRAYRYKSGSTDDFGGLGLVLVNDQDSALEITVIESIPWLFRLFLHQAEFTLNYKHVNDVSKYLKQFSIVPAIVRKRNLLIQSKWLLPPQSRIQILVPFEREFLRIDEFPQNSERGIEMPGALIFYKQSDYVVVYTETTNTLLYTWPIPDATMPFNVITMTSTLAALFYGSFFNLIFRRFYLKHANDPPPGAIPKLIWNIKKKFIK